MFIQLDSNNNPIQVIPNIDSFSYYGRTITGAGRMPVEELAANYQVFRLVKKREGLRNYEIPSDSPPYYEFDLEHFVVYEVYSHTLMPINLIKSDLMNKAKMFRDDARAQGFAFKPQVAIIDGFQVPEVYVTCPATRNEQADIMAVILSYKTGLKTGLLDWKVGTNCYIKFQSQEEVIRFGLQMDSFIQNCFGEEARVCKLIGDIEDHQRCADTVVKDLFKIERFIPVNHDVEYSKSGLVYYTNNATLS